MKFLMRHLLSSIIAYRALLWAGQKALSTHSNDVRLLRIQVGESPWQINLELSSPTSTV